MYYTHISAYYYVLPCALRSQNISPKCALNTLRSHNMSPNERTKSHHVRISAFCIFWSHYSTKSNITLYPALCRMVLDGAGRDGSAFRRCFCERWRCRSHPKYPKRIQISPVRLQITYRTMSGISLQPGLQAMLCWENGIF